MKGIFTAGEKEITSGELGLHFLKAPAKFSVSRVKIEGQPIAFDGIAIEPLAVHKHLGLILDIKLIF